ncbi:MAG TPA: hypothetical protein VLA37_10095 [Sphingomonadaceae bacterium]|nr:hypothetical protein [Sphingomonadaceae bacterium]
MGFTFEQWLMIAIALAVAFKLGSTYGRLSADSDRIQPISTTRISPEARARIDDALRRKEKIEAIRFLREDTGCGLAEAKKTIESLGPTPD